ncbi:MAG: hypothetical protein ACFWTY_22005 [Shouchella clausii]
MTMVWAILTFDGGQNADSGSRVVGSNPARRVLKKHIARCVFLFLQTGATAKTEKARSKQGMG